MHKSSSLSAERRGRTNICEWHDDFIKGICLWVEDMFYLRETCMRHTKKQQDWMKGMNRRAETRQLSVLRVKGLGFRDFYL